MGDLLDVVGIGHCRRERGSRGRVFNGLCGRAQDVSRHPALSCGRLDVGRTKNKVHVLLIGGQDLDDLSLTDADLVLFERRVVLSDQHGGGDAITAAFTVLRRREERMEKKRVEDERGQHREEESEEKMEMTEERMRRIEDKVTVCLCGLDNSPADCDAIIADPDLRRSSRRSGPRRRSRNSNNQSVSSLAGVQLSKHFVSLGTVSCLLWITYITWLPKLMSMPPSACCH